MANVGPMNFAIWDIYTVYNARGYQEANTHQPVIKCKW